MGAKKDVFGSTIDGKVIERFTLTNSHGLTVQLISYGAIITSIQTPDSKGCIEEITLGFDDVDDYEKDTLYLGAAVIGRVCGRIGKGQFTMDGKNYSLPCNLGKHHLHGGFKGFSKSIWSGECKDDKVTMTLVSPDGDEGYPGELTTVVTFELTESGELCMESRATSTKPTPVNFTSHPYFNLSLLHEKNILNHSVQIFSDKYLPFDEEVLPSGEILDVTGSHLDLRKPVLLSECIKEVNQGDGFDTGYVLQKDQSAIKTKQLAARVEHKGTGRYMEVYTTKPSLNFYTSHYAIGLKTRGGHVVPKYGALAIETQHYADSVNHENFPSIIIRPGEEYRHSCSYKFGVL